MRQLVQKANYVKDEFVLLQVPVRYLSSQRRVDHWDKTLLHIRWIPPRTPVVRQQSPSLIIVLCATADIVAPRQHPDHPAGLLGRQPLGQALCIRLQPRRVVVHGEAPLRQDHRKVVHCRVARVEGLEAVAQKAAFQGSATGHRVGVVVDFQDDLVCREVCVGEDSGARGEGRLLNYRGEEGIEAQAGEEDERDCVCVVDGCCALFHISVPVFPVVCCGVQSRVVGGLAKLIAEGHGRQGSP